MKQICQSKYEQETIEQEYHFLKQQMNNNHLLNQSVDCSSISQSTAIHSIQNTNIREQLFNQYKDIATQSRRHLFDTYMKSIEDQREQYKKKYQENVKKMWIDYYSSDKNHQLSSIMIQLINERCQKISERIQCIYKFKRQITLSSTLKL